MTDKYIEVWNKVDLVKDEDMEWLTNKVEQESMEAEYPIVMLSATEGYNKQVFLTLIS